LRPLDALAQELRERHRIKVRTFAADLARAGAASDVWQRITGAAGSVDILVNNAGLGVHGEFHRLAPEDVDALVNVNVAALAALTRLALPAMIDRGRGRILNVASLVAYQPGGPGWAAYYASKAFVLSFSKGLHRELRGTGVTVTALCPGPASTSFATESGAAEVPLYQWLPKLSAAAIARDGYRGLLRGSDVVIPGLAAKLMAFAGELPPRRVALEINQWLLRRG